MTEPTRQWVTHDDQQDCGDGGEGKQGRERAAEDVEDPVASPEGARVNHPQARW
jgi:hypothetical protein